MKPLLIIFLLVVAVVITAGCATSPPTPQTNTITPKPTLTKPTITKVQDPIIGVWRISNSQGYDDRYRFNADGTYNESFYVVDSDITQIHSGTWSAQGGNSYTKRETITGVSKTFSYDPTTNTIYFTELSHLRLTPYKGVIANGIVFTTTKPPINNKPTTLVQN